MITFNTDTELEIVDKFNEETDNIDENHNETFKAGEPVDADIVSEDGEYVDLQFGGGGGIAFGVQRSCFTVVNEKVITA
jgi:hypothetical protein